MICFVIALALTVFIIYLRELLSIAFSIFFNFFIFYVI
nr:MAG TPA: hypothetical protein [Caudoviricetes sp.]